MSQSKPLRELTDEELLKSLEDNTFYQDKDAFDISIMNFLDVYQIQPGKDEIAVPTLHKLYQLWSKTRISTETFENRICSMLPITTRTKKLMLNINRNLLDLNKEIEKQIIKSKAKSKMSRSVITQMHNFVRHYEFKNGTYEWPDAVIHALLRKYAIQRRTKFTDGVSLFKWFKLNGFTTKLQQDRYFICLNKKPEELFTPEDIQRYEEIWKKAYKKVRKKGTLQVPLLRSEAKPSE